MILKRKVSKLTSQCQLVRNTKAIHLTDWFGILSKALDCDGEVFEVTGKEWGWCVGIISGKGKANTRKRENW